MHGQFGQTFAIVVQRHGGIASRDARKDFELQLGKRDVHREQRVALGIGVFFTNVDQGQFSAGQQCLAYVGKGSSGSLAHRVACSGVGEVAAASSLERSQMLGRTLLV